MPTLDDAPTIESLLSQELDAANVGTTTTLASQDLIFVFDMSQRKVKTITAKELMESFNDAAVSVTSGTA